MTEERSARLKRPAVRLKPAKSQIKPELREAFDRRQRPDLFYARETIIEHVDVATRSLRDAVDGRRLSADALQEVAEAFAAFRSELNRAREAVLGTPEMLDHHPHGR